MVLIINTGGTFSKRYDKISGKLYVPKDNKAIEKITSKYINSQYIIKGIIHKDSLDISDIDREIISQEISNSSANKIILIHGTDTMGETAKFLNNNIKNKLIILTGAMKPFETDNTEATINIAMCLGFIQNNQQNGVHICMSGIIEHFENIAKNKQKGIFEKKTSLE